MTGIILLCLAACSNHTGNKSLKDKNIPESTATADQQKNTIPTAIPKNQLTEIYTQAITEFIKAAYRKDKITFDTLYFGKHVYGQPDDFPDIELPSTIEHTQIRLISPELGQKKQAERKSLVNVNMMGWIDQKQAEFLLVVFSDFAKHQYDYYINFIYHASSNKFELDNIAFEDYRHLNGQKPKRIIIFKDGKFVGE